MAIVGAVFFDIGGVIVHSSMEQSIVAGCKYFGCTPEDLGAEVAQRIHSLEIGKIDSETFWRDIGESLKRRGKGHPAEPETYRDLWKTLFVATAKLDQNVMSLCLKLNRNRLAVGVLSNVIKDHMDPTHQLGAYQNFKPILLSCMLGCRKPEPKIYQYACKKVMLSPEECLLVDDSKENLDGARAVGMQTLLYTDYPNLLRGLQKFGVIL